MGDSDSFWLPKDRTSYRQETNSPLELSPNKNAVSSEFGHGSYSGADIQIYAHYRANPRDVQLLAKMRDQFIEELYDIDLTIRSIVNNAQPNIAIASDITNSLGGLKDKKIYLEKEIKKAESAIQKATGEVVFPLGTIHTFSYSTFREKFPTRSLGRVYPKSYTRGSRTISGSMIFTVVNHHVFYDFLKLNQGQYNTGVKDYDYLKDSTAITDQLPPLDISLVFNNEYGSSSYMGLYGVEFIQDGATFSVEDIYSENVMQYVARDIDLMGPIGYRKTGKNGIENAWADTATSMSDYNKQINTKNRRNPFF